jgi:hypothetical protein
MESGTVRAARAIDEESTLSKRPIQKNTLILDGPFGECWINLVHGSIADSLADVLVLTSHSNPKQPLQSNTIGAMQNRYGISLTDSPWARKPLKDRDYMPMITPPVVAEGRRQCGVPGTHRYRHSKALPEQMKELLLVRLPASRAAKDPRRLYDRIIWSLVSSLSALELDPRPHPFESVAIPLIGGGSFKGYDRRMIMATMLRYLKEWLPGSQHVRTVELYAFHDEETAEYSELMDEELDLGLQEFQTSEAVNALRAELVKQLGPYSQSPTSEKGEAFGNELLASLMNPGLSFHNIGHSGRKVAEYICQTIGEGSGDRNLTSRIDALEGIAPWIRTHLHNLRTLGSQSRQKTEIGHPRSQMSNQEMLSLMVSIHRLIVFLEIEMKE